MDAILAGACGYLMKDSSIQDLMQGIRAASVGESLISPHIASKAPADPGGQRRGGGRGPAGARPRDRVPN